MTVSHQADRSWRYKAKETVELHVLPFRFIHILPFKKFSQHPFEILWLVSDVLLGILSTINQWPAYFNIDRMTGDVKLKLLHLQ